MVSLLINSKELNEFFTNSRAKSLLFLRNKYPSLIDEDFEDIYQESSIALYQNIMDGKLTQLSGSLYTYFLSICKNQTEKWIRDNHILSKTNFADTFDLDYEELDEDRLYELRQIVGSELPESQDNINYQNWIEDQVREGVKNMQPPCNQVLWSYYWDGFSHKAIATLYGMKSEDVCKTQASRCKHKFSEYLKKIIANYER